MHDQNHHNDNGAIQGTAGKERRYVVRRSIRNYVGGGVALAALLATATLFNNCSGDGFNVGQGLDGVSLRDMRWRRPSPSPSPAPAPAPAPAPGPSVIGSWGVDVNVYTSTQDVQNIATVMKARGLTSVRTGIYTANAAWIAQLRSSLSILKAANITAELIVANEFSGWDTQPDCVNANLAQVEQSSYTETTTMVQQVMDYVQIFELQNEVEWISKVIVPGANGAKASDFQTPCGYYQAANMRGMARAISDLRKSTGVPLRIMVGVTQQGLNLGQTNPTTGFLDFMIQQGVTFDLVSFHAYPRQNDLTLDQVVPNSGYTLSPLQQIAKYGKPIRLNEFNCGESYFPNFTNTAGDPVTETCFQGLDKHLKALVRQTQANIESLSFYELRDEPNKGAPENRFGLMYDLSNPKISLFIAGLFAGGTLSSAEMSQLTSRTLGK